MTVTAVPVLPAEHLFTQMVERDGTPQQIVLATGGACFAISIDPAAHPALGAQQLTRAAAVLLSAAQYLNAQR